MCAWVADIKPDLVSNLLSGVTQIDTDTALQYEILHETQLRRYFNWGKIKY